jgi:hypothetical protein
MKKYIDKLEPAIYQVFGGTDIFHFKKIENFVSNSIELYQEMDKEFDADLIDNVEEDKEEQEPEEEKIEIKSI